MQCKLAECSTGTCSVCCTLADKTVAARSVSWEGSQIALHQPYQLDMIVVIFIHNKLALRSNICVMGWAYSQNESTASDEFSNLTLWIRHHTTYCISHRKIDIYFVLDTIKTSSVLIIYLTKALWFNKPALFILLYILRDSSVMRLAD